jgi:hypothetical protein
MYYWIAIEEPLPFISHVNESMVVMKEEVLTGGEWRSTYIWLLFKWIRVRKLNLGLS